MSNVSPNYSPNYCSSDGYTFMPPGDNQPSESESGISDDCIAKAGKAALSATACAVGVASSAGTGGLTAWGAALACAMAAQDGVEAYNACK